MTKSLISKSLKSLPSKTPKNLKKLLEFMGKDIPTQDAKAFDPEFFADVTHTHWRLALKRKDNKSNVRIYCPIVKKQKLKKTIIDIVSDDMVFLVDSVVAEINRHNLLIDLLLHPMVYARYDSKGALVDISDKEKKGYIRQSHIHIQIKEVTGEETQMALEEGLRVAMDDVRAANVDWRPMLAELKTAKEELAQARTKEAAKDIQEYCDFLDYLHNNNFTLLGFREYEFVEKGRGLKSKTLKSKSLGLLRDDLKPAYISENKEGLPRNLQEMRRSLRAVSVSKTNQLATVHRRVPMDAIAIKTYDSKGNVKGEKLFIGLFTSVTYSRSVEDVPLLRSKVEEVLGLSDYLENSHDRKALRHILEKYPRDEIFQISPKELFKIAKDIVHLQERQRIALFMRRDSFRRYISCLIYVPRDRFGTTFRTKMGEILEQELKGTISSFTTSLDDSVFARVMFIINVDQKNPPVYKSQDIEERLQQAGQTWSERLGGALAREMDDKQAINDFVLKYGTAFPLAYTARFQPAQAIFDIKKIEFALDHGNLELDLYRSNDLPNNQLRLKVYNLDDPLNLSDVMPILDYMGLRAISELPFEVKVTDRSVWIHDFLLEIPKDANIIYQDRVKENFETAFRQIWNKELESDSLNELVGRLTGREVVILRAYVRYLKQINFPYGQLYVQKALVENSKIAGMIIDYFMARHDPKAKMQADQQKKNIEKALQSVDSLDQDRILRTLTKLVEATLRTNYFQKDQYGHLKSYMSFKLDSEAVPDMPQPKPYREIFVYSPRVEGIHLRGGKIARGGLRWSDRHEDFRTEVLGLMKAQMVKNSVIIPVGSKGGFVVKTLTHSRDEFRAEGVECYKTFIRGLLDITDNRKGTKVVPPENVMRHDGDDPYFVVAADKGTATFSDTANALSAEYNFWLGDAFASGGSAGYDHKKMGITARGAWESVKLHFRQLNHDIQTQNFDVVGVGDMGGDVFGNGMLLSKHICLVGAFNHLHIFCDPDPDPASTFKERTRLFKGVMGWDQYDKTKLSKGGRIYSRSDKTLTLTPEIQARFDLPKKQVSPIELMNAMLKARTDLMWFGGIGTYVKASSESHAEVGDKSNDNIRINGKDMRAKVLGEGANLGITQLARIEFEENGGRINADFIDNSGGVDSSDHEVNIKILLADVMSKKSSNMNIKSRNKLLEKMTSQVASHVLRNNYQQAQAISLVEFQAKERLQVHEEFIQDLERERDLNRALEGLPSSEEVQERLRLGKGLTRPELCVLVSYAKIQFTQEILASDVPDDPDMFPWMRYYFPETLHGTYDAQIKRHRLNREIIATTIANSLVNRMGPTFMKTAMKETGASCSDIAKAYMITRDIFGFRKLWADIEGLDNKVPAEIQLRSMTEISDLAAHTIKWFIQNSVGGFNIAELTDTFSHGVGELRKNMTALGTKALKDKLKSQINRNIESGMPKALAENIAFLPVLKHACNIIQISLKQKLQLPNVAKAYFEIGETFNLDWLRTQAEFLTSDDYWHSEATEGLMEQFYICQAQLAVHILKKEKRSKDSKGSVVQKWLEKNSYIEEQLKPLFSQLRRAGSADLARLVIAEQRLRAIYNG